MAGYVSRVDCGPAAGPEAGEASGQALGPAASTLPGVCCSQMDTPGMGAAAGPSEPVKMLGPARRRAEPIDHCRYTLPNRHA